MSDSVSRSKLEEALARISNEIGVQRDLGLDASEVAFGNDLLAVSSAVRAILDGEPVEWCVVHDSSTSRLSRQALCDLALVGRMSRPCRIESQIRIRSDRVKGFQCWFCNRRFVIPGEHPIVWVEFICGRSGCLEQTWRWGP